MRQELDEKVNNIHCLESKLYSHNLKLAGTVDCIAEYKGVLSVIDFKTSIRLKKKENISGYFMQGAAYAQMFNEMADSNIEQIVILIGVDTAMFCQTMIVRGEEIAEYKAELQTYIDNYYQKTLLLNTDVVQ